MPPKNDKRDSEKIDSRSHQPIQKEAVSKTEKGLRESRRIRTEAVLRRPGSGLDPRQAVSEWFDYAEAKNYALVTGQRKFTSDLARVDACLEEEQSLFEFCRDRQLTFAENIALLLAGPPTREGVEHRVYYSLAEDPPRVTKITFPGKYGRIEHTPFLYLERLALLQSYSPSWILGSKIVSKIPEANIPSLARCGLFLARLQP